LKFVDVKKENAMAFNYWSPRSAGIVATAGFLLLSVFQASLVLGAPLGDAAWGGESSELPIGFRFASVVATFLYILAAAIVMQRSELKNMGFSASFVGGLTRFLTVFFFFETVLNFASRSPIERWIWGPVCLILAGCCLTLARMEISRNSSVAGHGDGGGLSEDDHLLSDTNIV
jgi:hypothetical protein